MIDTLTDITSALCLIWAFVLIGLTLIGIKRLLDAIQRERLFRITEHLNGDILTETGISIIVCGNQTPEQIEQRLSSNYTMYELVLITDFDNDPAAEELLRKYAMVQVEHALGSELACGSVKNVYRSRQRRYRRLVIIDRHIGSLSDAYNCGTEIAAYDHIIALDRWTFLHPDALRIFNTELHERAGEKSSYPICTLSMTDTIYNPLHMIDTSLHMLLLCVGLNASGDSRQTLSSIILFPRRHVIDTGGFAEDFNPNDELLRRIRQNQRMERQDWNEIFVPQIVAIDTSSHIRKRHTRTYPYGGIHNLPPLLLSLFWISVLLLLLFSFFKGENIPFQKSLLTLLTAYLAMAAAASLSTTIVDEVFRPLSQQPNFPRLALNIFIYPFYRFAYIISPKNFVKL